MRTPLIVANWKMNKSLKDAQQYGQELLELLADYSGVEVVVCPPFTSLTVMSQIFRGSEIKLGAQNLFWEMKGAYTGEISPAMLVDAGCNCVILGHSERRQIMGENDAIINRKVRAALDAGLIPILCVGETLQERENNRAREVVKEQLTRDLQSITFAPQGLVIAYEPVWAIGTGVNSSSDDAQEMIGFIRNYLAKIYDRELAKSVRILYGGSVNEENIAEFMGEVDVDGALVGGASLQANSFARIVRFK
ncbi:MAG: triose-phosphate isomerase [Syntrophomonadaceae bacterium]|nr:triose-phosphate isomerase [Syntrophomonadaceae bacterium]MDD3271099.1 triose-phosphate isomerase [Syntrophomonadaceae bacterium]MDD3898073.1 triose-phosphate isomerase [Syntrophomonadaceae bacterium]